MRPAVDDRSLEQTVLDLHNDERGRLGIPLLSIDSSLSKGASDWASQRIAEHVFYHGAPRGIGENIAWRTYDPSKTINAQAALLFNQWLGERANFVNNKAFPDCRTPNSTSDITHYTQIIWKNSKRLGVGIANDGNWIFLCTRYSPEGNISGEYTY